MKCDNNNPFEGVYNCQNTIKDCLDVKAYPEANAALGNYMYESAVKSGKNQAFPLICHHNDGFYYIALYLFIWVLDKVLVERFILRLGFRLNQTDENQFYSYCDLDNLECDPGMLETFMFQFFLFLNGWNRIQVPWRLNTDQMKYSLDLKTISMVQKVIPTRKYLTCCLMHARFLKHTRLANNSIKHFRSMLWVLSQQIP